MGRDLTKLTNGELVDRFCGYAIQQQLVLLDSNTKKYNRLYDRMKAIDAELRARGPEARRSLLALLEHENARVRYAAAVKSLAIAPEQSIATLKAIVASHEMPEAGDAGMALYHLEKGISKPT